jgi:membrane protease YdiL (CAAX protease family)
MRTGLLAVEFLVVFCVLPLLLASPWVALPQLAVLIAVAAGCLVVLGRDKTFDRRRLWNGAGVAAVAGDVGRHAFSALVGVVWIVAMFFPARLLDLPLQRPLVWLALLVLYPIVSAYPQEVVFRAFLLHRYRPIFGDGKLAIAASAITFSFAHVVFGNWVAVGLTLPAGALLAVTYRRSGSLAAATLEHAAYGVIVFTFGLARYFGVGRF